MTNKVKPIRSYTPGVVPTAEELDQHELAINWADLILFTKGPSGDTVVAPLGSTAAMVFTQSPSSDQNDYAVSGDIVRLNPSANVTLSGLAGGEDGVVKILCNVGTHVVTLSGGNTASAETNRFAIASGSVELEGGDSASIWYDGTSQRWRVLEDQVAGASGGSGGGIAMAYLFGG